MNGQSKTPSPISPQSPFHFVISGDLQDFAVFCAIIRGEDLSAGKIADLTAKLRQHTETLVAAENAAKP